ncbi:hypothetical protein DKK70_16005 [Gilliamella apicola]|uniref:Uncharacterized protein n=1 Tax=Gilliamella apicola TaxID=1196095 RepID=A0A2V4DT14_9GAMM|nr:hypothetical protein [Gilliamella apicola]PXZ03722.1 hypothetical protein DKK70_16005 [Gilliamella apicola]
MRRYRGQAEAFYDDGDFPFSIEEYKKFHELVGDYETGYLPYCARAVSSVLDEYGLDETYFLPGSLEDAVKEVEKKKGLSNENH